MTMSSGLSLLRVRPLAGNRARGWLTAGPFRVPCALGPAGIVRMKREGDKGTYIFTSCWMYPSFDGKPARMTTSVSCSTMRWQKS